jgi:CRP/FNR family cyclic AMP-dependent transcriptional regulator
MNLGDIGDWVTLARVNELIAWIQAGGLNGHLVDFLGWLAAAFVLTSFYLRTMIPLRVAAIGSNIIFIAYGFLAGAIPILVLHTLLLPLNATRLIQMKILVSKVKFTTYGNMWANMLIPYMTVRKLPKGTLLFDKGDFANALFYILKGSVRIVGRDKLVHMGHLVGEMGIFTAQQRRTDGAICETNVEIASITQDKIWELIHQNPEFGVYLLKIVVQRMTETHD